MCFSLCLYKLNFYIDRSTYAPCLSSNRIQLLEIWDNILKKLDGYLEIKVLNLTWTIGSPFACTLGSYWISFLLEIFCVFWMNTFSRTTEGVLLSYQRYSHIIGILFSWSLVEHLQSYWSKAPKDCALLLSLSQQLLSDLSLLHLSFFSCFTCAALTIGIRDGMRILHPVQMK